MGRAVTLLFVALVLVLCYAASASAQPLSWLSLTAHLTPAQLASPSPSSRDDPGAGYDARRARIVIFGGRGAGGEMDDSWAFSLLSLTWEEISPPVGQPRPPARFSMVSALDSTSDRFIVSTGQGPSGPHFDDLWSMDLATGRWTEHEPAGPRLRKRYGSSGGIPTQYVWSDDVAASSADVSIALSSVVPADALTGAAAHTFSVTHGFSKDRFQDTFLTTLDSAALSMGGPLPVRDSGAGHAPFNRCLHAGAVASNGLQMLWAGCGSKGFGPCPAHDTHVLNARTNQWIEVDKCASPKLYAAATIWPDKFMGTPAAPSFREHALLFGGKGGIWRNGARGEVNVLDMQAGQWVRYAPRGIRRARFAVDGSVDLSVPPLEDSASLPPLTAHHKLVTVYRPPQALLTLMGLDATATSPDAADGTRAPPALVWAWGGGLGGEMFLLGGSTSSTQTMSCPYVFPLRQFHAGIMFVAWGVLLPLGVMVARYGKVAGVIPVLGAYTSAPASKGWTCCRESSPPVKLWFIWHRMGNLSALLLIIGGLIAAIIMVPLHAFSLPHHIIGIIAIALALWQPLNALCRPHPPSPGVAPSLARRVWEQLHRWSGRLGLAMAWVNIFLGVAVIHAHYGFHIGFALWLLLLAATTIVLESRLRKFEEAGGGKTLEKADAPFVNGNGQSAEVQQGAAAPALSTPTTHCQAIDVAAAKPSAHDNGKEDFVEMRRLVQAPRDVEQP